MRRGQEFTDYINASFIDVSTCYFLISSLLMHKTVPVKLKSLIFSRDSGIQTQGLLHRHTGPSAAHSGGLLENGLGVEMSLHGNAH